jgi:hypothetical protein
VNVRNDWKHQYLAQSLRLHYIVKKTHLATRRLARHGAMMITMKCMMFNSVSVSKVKNHIKWQPKSICTILDKNSDQMCSVQVTTEYRQEIQPNYAPSHKKTDA